MKEYCKIIDPHTHLWQISQGYYGWISAGKSELLGDLAPLNRDYLPKHYLADSRNFKLEKLIHIEAASAAYAREEVDWVARLQSQHDIIGGIVAGVNLLDSEVEKDLAFYRDHFLVKGVRQILNWHADSKYRAAEEDLLDNPLWARNFAMLGKYHLSFDMQICPSQMMQAYRLAQHHQDVAVIVNHGGMPIAKDYGIWQAGIRKLSECPNVTIKLSGFGMLDHHWTKPSIKAAVYFIIEQFGTSRCMFASNFPVDKLYGSFEETMGSYFSLVSDFSSSEQEDLFFKTAKSSYKME